MHLPSTSEEISHELSQDSVVRPYPSSRTALGVGTAIAASAPTSVPPLIPYSGVALSADGRALSGEAGMTFLLFKEERGGEPLWTETQVVALDSTGHYKVQLGAANPNGLPSDIFATGEGRWLEVQIAGQPPQPRVLLMSVPYAMKAADAATLGGLPASAFALAGTRLAANGAPSGGTATGAVPDIISTVTTTGGTSGYLPRFSGTSTIVDSEIFDTGTSVGIGKQPNPAAILDVNGATILRGGVQLSRTGSATPAAGTNSFPFGFYAQAYDSATAAIVNPNYLVAGRADRQQHRRAIGDHEPAVLQQHCLQPRPASISTPTEPCTSPLARPSRAQEQETARSPE